jgi:adenosine deaminase
MTSATAFRSPEQVPQAIQQLPTCNLHTHLEGSIRPDTVWELAQEIGLALPVGRDQVADQLQVSGEERSLIDYLEKIAFAYPALRTAEALRRTSYEAALDAAADGVVYFELRAGPVTHTGPDLSIEQAIAAMLEGLRQAEAEVGIVARLIVAALRNHEPEVNTRLAHIAVEFQPEGVVGFDLAGDEANYPAQLHAEAFHVARRGGLGITVHAGEAGGADNVRYAVEVLGATRIGHGVRSVEESPVVDLLRDRGILLEICPTSNVHTYAVPAIEAHPVRHLYDHGIPISIGDDDPVTSRTRVSRELALLHERFGFSLPELRAIQRMGLRAAFLRDEAQRRELLALLDA